MKAPTYKIAKHLVKSLNKHITLNNQYNIRNLTSLAADLVKLNLSKDHQLKIYDIKDLYVIIPIEETLTITKLVLLKERCTYNTINNNINGSCSITELFHVSKSDISTRKRSLNGLTNL